MKVLVACEFSGRVRDAFTAKGHEAWSCDLIPSRTEGNHHIGDALAFAKSQHWDLLIAHPPCTYLSNAGVRWLYKGPKGTAEICPQRWQSMLSGVEFFLSFYNLPIPKIAIENPIPHKFASKELGLSRTQIIYPWQFGHQTTKPTCLWLKGLPKLRPTKIIPRSEGRWSDHTLSSSLERGRIRSITYQGIADAMGNQWG